MLKELLPQKIKFKLPGLRILKTGLAIFLCFLIAYWRGREDTVFYSVIAAIICLRNDVTSSLKMGVDRMIGTIIGGLFGLCYIKIEILGQLPDNNVVLHYFLLSVCSMFLIWLAASLDSPGSAVITSIVFLSIVLNHGRDVSPEIFAINRIIETFVGILTAIIVNYLPRFSRR